MEIEGMQAAGTETPKRLAEAAIPLWAVRAPEDARRGFTDKMAGRAAARSRKTPKTARLNARGACLKNDRLEPRRPATVPPAPKLDAPRLAEAAPVPEFGDLPIMLKQPSAERAPRVGRRWSGASGARVKNGGALGVGLAAACLVLTGIVLGAVSPRMLRDADSAVLAELASPAERVAEIEPADARRGAAAPVAQAPVVASLEPAPVNRDVAPVIEVPPVTTAQLTALLVEASAAEAGPVAGEAWFALPDDACAIRMLEFARAPHPDAPSDLTLSRVGPLTQTPCAGAPVEDISTDSIPDGAQAYLSSAELLRLLSDRPEKCVLDPEATEAGCVETTRYAPSSALFTRLSPLENGAALEINGAFAVEGDEICHFTPGLTALVLGKNVDPIEAEALERQVEEHYRDGPGEICHRLRPAGLRDGHRLYVADAFIGGAPAEERSDPRPFEMRASLGQASALLR